jgi:hypothetical protein
LAPLPSPGNLFLRSAAAGSVAPAMAGPPASGNLGFCRPGFFRALVFWALEFSQSGRRCRLNRMNGSTPLTLRPTPARNPKPHGFGCAIIRGLDNNCGDMVAIIRLVLPAYGCASGAIAGQRIVFHTMDAVRFRQGRTDYYYIYQMAQEGFAYGEHSAGGVVWM